MFAILISSTYCLLLLSFDGAKALPQPHIAVSDQLVEMKSSTEDGNFHNFIEELPEQADSVFSSLTRLLKEQSKSTLFSDARKRFDAAKLDIPTFTKEFIELSEAVGISEQVADVKKAIADINRIIDAKDGDAKKLATSQFIQNYESNYRNLADSVFDDFVRENSTKTLNAVRHITKEYRQKVQDFGMGLAELALQSAQIEITYTQLKHKDDEKLKSLRNEWLNRMNVVRDELTYADSATKDAYSFQHAQDYQDFVRRSTNLSPQEFSVQLFDLMERKYNWRYWAVITFEYSGGYQQATNFCNGGYDNRGKFIVTYASQDKTINNFSAARAINLINNSQARSYDQAWQIRDELNARSGGCNNFALIWVACANCGQHSIHMKWHKDHNSNTLIVAKNNRTYKVLLFG